MVGRRLVIHECESEEGVEHPSRSVEGEISRVASRNPVNADSPWERLPSFRFDAFQHGRSGFADLQHGFPFLLRVEERSGEQMRDERARRLRQALLHDVGNVLHCRRQRWRCFDLGLLFLLLRNFLSHSLGEQSLSQDFGDLGESGSACQE